LFKLKNSVVTDFSIISVNVPMNIDKKKIKKSK